MSPKPPSNKHIPTAFLPLATAFESLSQRRIAGGIDAVAVQRALGLRSLFLADRLLAALGGGHRRFETAEEFVAVAQRLMSARPGDKLEFLFKLHDVNGDGCITRPELDCLMHIVLAENDLKLPPDATGVVYMPGIYSKRGAGVLRSTDYGETWTHVGTAMDQAAIFGSPCPRRRCRRTHLPIFPRALPP